MQLKGAPVHGGLPDSPHVEDCQVGQGRLSNIPFGKWFSGRCHLENDIAEQLSGSGQVVSHPVKVQVAHQKGPCRRTICHRIFYKCCVLPCESVGDVLMRHPFQEEARLSAHTE